MHEAEETSGPGTASNSTTGKDKVEPESISAMGRISKLEEVGLGTSLGGRLELARQLVMSLELSCMRTPAPTPVVESPDVSRARANSSTDNESRASSTLKGSS